MDHVMSARPDEPDFTGWLPIRVFPNDGTAWVDWVYRGDYRFQDSFFRDDITYLLRKPFNRAFRRYTPIADMVNWADRSRGRAGFAPLRALVAHASRCGSTLVTQMLARLPSHVVMSEPPMVDAILRIHSRLPNVSRDEQIRWLQALIFALGQTPGAERHLVIKLDAWHIRDHALLSDALPGVPWIFLYRDPVEIAASMFTQPSAYMAAGMVTAYSGLADNEALDMRMEDFIARDLGLVFDAAVPVCEQHSVTPVHYPSLPDAVWTELADVLGLSRDAGELALLQQAATRDAKAPSLTFEPDSARKQREASALLRQLVTARCADSYQRLLALSAQVTVPHALIPH
jgi:gluconate kinase